MYHVYILECSDGTLYTGVTNDLEKRLILHNDGTASKYTRSRLPVALRYSEKHPDRSSALKREHQIKQLPRGKKLSLIR